MRSLDPAERADRLHSIRLRGCWPPSKRKRPAVARGALSKYQPGKLNLNGSFDTTATAERAIAKALVRAHELELLGAVQLAAALRAVVR